MPRHRAGHAPARLVRLGLAGRRGRVSAGPLSSIRRTQTALSGLVRAVRHGVQLRTRFQEAEELARHGADRRTSIRSPIYNRANQSCLRLVFCYARQFDKAHRRPGTGDVGTRTRVVHIPALLDASRPTTRSQLAGTSGSGHLPRASAALAVCAGRHPFAMLTMAATYAKRGPSSKLEARAAFHERAVDAVSDRQWASPMACTFSAATALLPAEVVILTIASYVRSETLS